jgi:hypothetical protein
MGLLANNIALIGDEYRQCIEKIAVFLDLKMHKFELLIDLISGNPFQIFQCKIPDNIMNFKLNDMHTLKYSFKRINEVALIVGQNNYEVRQLCNWWCYLYIQLQYAQKCIEYLFNDIIGIDPTVTQLVCKFRDIQQLVHSTDNFNTQAVNHIVVDLIRNFMGKIHLQGIEDIEEDVEIVQKLLTMFCKIKNNEFTINVRARMKDEWEIVYFLFSIWDSIYLTSAESFLNRIICLSKLINDNFIQGNAYHFQKEREFILWFSLFVCLPMLNELIELDMYDNYQLSKAKFKFFEYYNLFEVWNEKFYQGKEVSSLIKTFLDSTIFDDLYERLITNVDFRKRDILKYIFPMVMSISLNCKYITVTSVSDLLSKEYDSDLVRGIISIILKWPEEVRCINNLLEKFDLDQKLALNLLKLVSKNKNESEIFSAWNELAQDHWNQAKLVSLIVAVLNRDLNTVVFLWQELNVGYHFKHIIYWGLHRFDLIENDLDLMSKKFDISSPQSLKSLLGIAWGNFNFILKDIEKREKKFDDNLALLYEAVFFITQKGTRIRQKKTKYIPKYINKYISVIVENFLK